MKSWLVTLLLLVSPVASADPAGVLKLGSDRAVDAVYADLYQALEEEKFWVVFESDMGKRMAGFADSWGEDYNRNHLDAIRSMVVCNIRWTNRIANADPNLLALCPLHLSLYAKDGRTFVLMPRLSAMAEGSPGKDVAAELEAELRGIVAGVLGAD